MWSTYLIWESIGQKTKEKPIWDFSQNPSNHIQSNVSNAIKRLFTRGDASRDWANEPEYYENDNASYRDIAMNIIQWFNQWPRENIRKKTLLSTNLYNDGDPLINIKRLIWETYYENLFNYILEDSDLDWYFESIFTAIFRLEHPEWFRVHINYYFRYAANEIANKNPEAGRIMNQIINSESSKLLLLHHYGQNPKYISFICCK